MQEWLDERPGLLRRALGAVAALALAASLLAHSRLWRIESIEPMLRERHGNLAIAIDPLPVPLAGQELAYVTTVRVSALVSLGAFALLLGCWARRRPGSRRPVALSDRVDRPVRSLDCRRYTTQQDAIASVSAATSAPMPAASAALGPSGASANVATRASGMSGIQSRPTSPRVTPSSRSARRPAARARRKRSHASERRLRDEARETAAQGPETGDRHRQAQEQREVERD